MSLAKIRQLITMPFVHGSIFKAIRVNQRFDITSRKGNVGVVSFPDKTAELR